MIYKEVEFGEKSRAKLLEGIDVLSNAVKTTLGPKGRNVIIHRPENEPHVTKDGVTVAGEIILKDELENMGAQMVLVAAERTAKQAGDGTTTATVLTQSIVKEGMKLVSAGMNPMDLKRGIDKAVAEIVKHLAEISIPCKTPEEVRKVATLSANSDAKIGNKIAEAIEAVGKTGAISIESGKSLEDELVKTDGLQIDRGYISAYFSTNFEAMTTVLEDCYIILYDRTIKSTHVLVPLLDKIAPTGKSVLIVAEDVEGEALQTLLMNHQSGHLNVCCIPAPGFADRRLPIMEDIATLTGGRVFSKELNKNLQDGQISDLGHCERIEVTNLTTTFINGSGDRAKILSRIQQIKTQLETASNEYNADKLRDRLAKLDGGVAVIKVGGATEVEIGEKKDRYDDSLNATRAAIDDGIIPGGGVGLLRAKQKLSNIETANLDQKAGVDIVLKAIESPARQIVDNAGGKPDVVINAILQSEGNHGYDAATGEFGDMMDLGIIDPTKVTKTALINAASVAGLLITSECSIIAKGIQEQKNEEYIPL